jgi:hypothetical protein
MMRLLFRGLERLRYKRRCLVVLLHIEHIDAVQTSLSTMIF